MKIKVKAKENKSDFVKGYEAGRSEAIAQVSKHALRIVDEELDRIMREFKSTVDCALFDAQKSANYTKKLLASMFEDAINNEISN